MINSTSARLSPLKNIVKLEDLTDWWKASTILFYNKNLKKKTEQSRRKLTLTVAYINVITLLNWKVFKVQEKCLECLEGQTSMNGL